MAKITSIDPFYGEMVERIADEFGLFNFVNIEIMAVSKAKEMIKISKANATIEYLSEKKDIVCIYIFEEAFSKLEEAQQELLIKDSLSMIYYDTEKDKLIINQPEIKVTNNGFMKYGLDLIKANECASLAIKQTIEKEKEQ